MEHIESLLHNDWIERCGGAWGSMIVLAPKPHQEEVTDINKFVWRMCVSYRKLNSITEPFEYPIPRCDDAVSILGLQAGEHLYFISLDAKQGYHQILVRKADREKLAFFAPDGHKYTFKVMPFGPTNAPSFYTCMMGDFQEDWNLLFSETISRADSICGKNVDMDRKGAVRMNGTKVEVGSKVIIDDILLYCTNVDILLVYLECVCQTFQKYRCSFQLKKCEFLKDRVEYVGHDLTPKGNCPAASKFDMINNWKLPKSGSSLHSFIGLLNIYHQYIPFMEIRLKPLRHLERRYRRKCIPQLAWTPDLVALFVEMKHTVTSSPVLARYNPTLPTFIKTDWSALGMAWILMQPASDKVSLDAAKKMGTTNECLFDLTKQGPRLQPIAYGSRSCTDMEKHFHSFVGEIGCGRWAFAQNKRYLWGAHFYWICDCSAVKEVLEYKGTIHMVCRWSQEMLGYNFTVVHRESRMMEDVDALSRIYDSDTATHCMIASSLKAQDSTIRPDAYDRLKFRKKPTRLKASIPITESMVPVLTESNIKTWYLGSLAIQHGVKEQPAHSFMITTTPLSFADPIDPTGPSNAADRPINTQTPATSIESVVNTTSVNIISVDDITDSTIIWSRFITPSALVITGKLFTSEHIQAADLNSTTSSVMGMADMSLSAVQSTLGMNPHMLDITFTPISNQSVTQWVKEICLIVHRFAQEEGNLFYCVAWIKKSLMSKECLDTCIALIEADLPSTWEYRVSTYNGLSFGHNITSERVCIELTAETGMFKADKSDMVTELTDSRDYGYGSIINAQQDNLEDDILSNENTIPVQQAGSIWRHDVTPSEAPTRAPYELAKVNFDGSELIVLHPDFPASEEVIDSCHLHTFGIPIKSSIIAGCMDAKLASFDNLIQLYCHQEQRSTHKLMQHSIDNTVNMLRFMTPYKLKEAILANVFSTGILDNLIFGDDIHCDAVQCYLVQKQPTVMDWTNAYMKDQTTKHLIEMLELRKSGKEPTKQDINNINSCYRQYFLLNQVKQEHGRITIHKEIAMMNRAIRLIVVPQDLQRIIFRHYHASPTGGHAGEYKTLHRIRMRFIWPKMRDSVKKWVKECAECVAANAWRTRRSELYFSWPTTIPFWIMHVDLWSPGSTIIKGKKGYLMNSLCDLTQFVVSSVTFDTTASFLAKTFMEDVVLTFGMCAVIVVDAASTFKGVFEEMCDILDITLWPLARGNHKGNSAEKYHRYLNKTQTIFGNAAGTHQNFTRNAKTTAYAWNSAPITDTDVTRSFAAVGREFRFPLDVKHLPPSSPTLDGNNALFDYLRNVGTDSHFATGVLQILIEERRMEHQARMNKSRTESNLKVGDVVKAHVQVQSKAASGEVEKLSYKARGPFIITKDLGFGSLEVAPYQDPTGARRKYKSTELYLLPPQLYPSEPLDTMDQRYLAYEHTPVVSPLNKQTNKKINKHKNK